MLLILLRTHPWLPVFAINVFLIPLEFLNLTDSNQAWFMIVMPLAWKLNITHWRFTDIPHGGKKHQALAYTTGGILATMKDNRSCGDIFLHE